MVKNNTKEATDQMISTICITCVILELVSAYHLIKMSFLETKKKQLRFYLISACVKISVLLQLSELPAQFTTSPFSCIIAIISWTAEIQNINGLLYKHWKTSLKKNCFSALVSKLNTGLINKG